jgi:hypothetical protein
MVVVAQSERDGRSAEEYNAGGMPLKTLHTLAQNKPFEYKYVDGSEIIVYPSDDESNAQTKYAIAITNFELQLVKNRVKDSGSIVVGASRDKPPKGSLGAMLKTHGCSPQILSYLSAILVAENFCMPIKQRAALALSFNKTAPA